MAEAEPGQDMDGDLKNEESTKSPMETSNQKETCSGIDQQGPEASRVTIEKNELEELPRERFQELWKAQDKYIDHLEEQIQVSYAMQQHARVKSVPGQLCDEQTVTTRWQLK